MSFLDGSLQSALVLRTFRVIVKFGPNLQLPQTAAAEAQHAAAHGNAWSALRKKFPGVKLQPVFTMIDAAALDSIEQRAAAAGLPSPRLKSYFAITVPKKTKPSAVAAAVAAWPHVELAYIEDTPGPPPSVNAADDPLSVAQGYLSAAKAGIDAHYAWTHADGSGIGLVDLEQGWILDHEDLPPAIPVIGPGVDHPDPVWVEHGTAVLGIVGAADNDKGVVGIAPGASLRVVSQWFEPPGQPGFFSTANALALAIAQMQAGEVLLIETTAPMADKFGWVPVDADPLLFDLIKTATGLGITVLEPAGNNKEKPGTKHVGGSNLDAFTDASGKFIFNRAYTTEFKDSGAIMVAAATSAVPHARTWFSNYGSRVDCYAWGENIVTCGTSPFTTPPGTSPQQAYMSDFAGCSGATAIVAGAAVLLQSWALKQFGHVLSPAEVRSLLSDDNLNTRSQSPSNDMIGVMPNLRRIIEHVRSKLTRGRWDAVFAILFGGVIYGGGGWSLTPGSPPQPVPPRVDRLEFEAIPEDQRDVLIGLALLQIAGLISDPVQRKRVEQSIATLMRAATDNIAAGIRQR